MTLNTLSSHVLDTTRGIPAAGMKLRLTTPDGKEYEAVTDEDGRCKDWQGCEILPGQYCLRFQTGDYLQQWHGSAFYPFVDVHFQVEVEGGHYHIPLLISPYGFSSYRGS